MKITVLTLFPEMYEGFLNSSIIRRIIEKKLCEVKVVDIRNYSKDKHHHVDDTPYGGMAGMLMKVDVVHEALLNNKSDNSDIAQGQTFETGRPDQIFHDGRYCLYMRSL